jgi:hypothetical protein
MRDDALSLQAESLSGVGAWRLDGATQQLQWTPQTWRLHGLEPGPGSLTLEAALAPVALPDRRRVMQGLQSALAGGQGCELDYAVVLPDASLQRLRATARYQPDEAGQPALLGITLAQPGQQAMAQEASLEYAVAAAGVGVWEMDLLTGEEAWSDHTLALYGLPAGSPAPTRPEWRRRFLHPADAPRVDARAAEFLATNEPYELDYRIRRADDGALRWLHTRAAFAFGGKRRVLGVTIDITELRQKDRHVTELLGRLQMATEASGIGAWERDARTGISRWDATTLALFGLPPDAPVPSREDFLARVVDEDRERVSVALRRADERFSALDVEYRITLPGGATRWLRSRGNVERDALGEPLRSIGVCFDTTAQREAEAAQQARVLAEQANAAKTEFLSRMSHELRTPLNAVLGFAQLLALDHADKLSAAQRERVGHIQAAGWHLLALVNDVLDLAKIESRQAQMVFARVPLAAVVQECVAMTAPAAAQAGVSLRVQPPLRDEGLAWTGRTRLKQVLLNLLSNGVKYNRPGGRVEITWEQLPSGPFELSVRDTRQGLSDEQLQRLFEPFNRLGREGSGIEGTGLGLARCKLILEQLGGTIEARSAPGEGSCFLVQLPAAASP